MQLQDIHKLPVAGKTVYVRVDYNVPLNDAGEITDDTRIRATLPTLQLLLDGGAALVLATHLGRPKGVREEKYSVRPAGIRLAELLGRPVRQAADCVGSEVAAQARALQPGEVLLLENVRFHPEEEANDPAFAKELASLADLAVNDAFGVSHRAHASVVGVAQHLPMVAGLLVAKEVEFLERATARPERPFVAVVGGAKVSDKIGVIARLLTIADTVIIGGGMANTFLLAQGVEIGTSLAERDKVQEAKDLLTQAETNGKSLLLPTDVVTAATFAASAEPLTVAAAAIPADRMVLDIGPETAARYAAALQEAKTIVWNGPMGVFEFSTYAAGTAAVARAVAAADAVSVVGGGDSVAAVAQCGVAEQISHISTGGGASLEYLEGRELPGIACLAKEA
ncbi:MAG: phosphoglycerate kinase [Veillonellaceae bacterium]|nr:phosphoglycerate kinase [Veillonellaceae bacterium]